jgi:hypothetical protein
MFRLLYFTPFDEFRRIGIGLQYDSKRATRPT